jgi:phosphoglycerate dehydrogenase-like enzyme
MDFNMLNLPDDTVDVSTLEIPRRLVDRVSHVRRPGLESIRPTGIFMLHQGLFDAVYGAPERTAVLAQMPMERSLMTPDDYEKMRGVRDDVEIVLSSWGMPRCDEVFFRRFPNIKAVFYAAGSVRAFTTDLFWNRGVRVTSAYAANAVPVAEFALSQILFSLKQGWQIVRDDCLGIQGRQHLYSPPGGYGSMVGLVGLGMIGRLVRERLRPFDVNVFACDPFVDAREAARLNVSLVTLDELFATADVVSCHAPLLPSTERMITGRHFASMKHGATFINTARGRVVREDEMIDVLRRRTDVVCVLDVTQTEPCPENSPLRHMRNVVLTPHIAGSVGRECQRMGALMVQELGRYLDGQPLLYEIDQKRAETLA